MTVAIENPIVDYLITCGGKDIMEFTGDNDIEDARQYADKLKSQNHKCVEIEQRNNRVIVRLVVVEEETEEQEEIWPSI